MIEEQRREEPITARSTPGDLLALLVAVFLFRLFGLGGAPSWQFVVTYLVCCLVLLIPNVAVRIVWRAWRQTRAEMRRRAAMEAAREGA